MLHAYQAYARTAKSGLSGRRLLAAALSQCATDLQRALDLGPAAVETGALVEALERNRRAWSIIAEELSDPESTLPEEFRKPLARLAAHTFRETFEICGAPGVERLQPLIDMNRTLAAGFEGAAAT